MGKKIRLTERELINLVQRIIKEDGYGISRFENPKMMGSFKDNRPSLIQRGVSKVKDFFTGSYNEEDFEQLKKIKSIIRNPPFDGAVEILRHNDSSVMFRAAGRIVYVDKDKPSIELNHKELKLGDKEDVEIEIRHIIGLLDL